jgi:DNA-binding NarL/FixJ family response regulator
MGARPALPTPTVVVVEDHPMMVSAIEAALSRAGISVLASAVSAAEGYDLVGTLEPDVVIVDIGLPDEDGIELTRRLLQRNAGTCVLLHTGLEDPVTLKTAFDCGASGFAYKTGPPESLAAAVRVVAAGGTYVAEELRAAIVANQRSTRPRTLTDRERQVLTLVAEGRSNEEIGAELMLAAETVRTHVRNAMKRLGTHTRAHAVFEALRNEEIGL